ncbi:GNAT family N-acetyltransferase [Bacillus spongiae]|uniref:GNAT family N-acetyltransferase n=1 Tax=Bacillus spongiae TaxID=2683610 RepID=A0ABU8HK13_9BACI
MKIVNSLSKVNIEEIKEVYHSVGWTKHNEENIKLIFNASHIMTFVLINNKVVGIGRALTDGIFNAAIYDVVVHQDYQGNGIASHLLTDILNKLEGISCIHLISTTANEAFYHKFGFKKVKTGMAKYRNPKLIAEYLE